MTHTPSQPITDMRGDIVSVGDTLAVAFRAGNQAALRIGTVVGFGEKKAYYSPTGYTDLIELDWGVAALYGRVTESFVKNSKIEASTKRFVILKKAPDGAGD